MKLKGKHKKTNLRCTLRRGFSIILSCLMVSTLFIPSTFAATEKSSKFTDIAKHWAKSYIEKAVESGFVKGYEDGTFKPDKEITRAEFVTMMNTAIGNDASSDTYFSDVNAFDWYVNQVSKAVAAGYVSGYKNGKFLPMQSITRQEAAVMIARIIPTYGSEKTLLGFKDYESIGSWAYNAVEKVYGKGYLGGYSDGKMHPQDNLTRAQAAKIIQDILDKETIYRDNLEIQKGGASLKNCIFANNMTVGLLVGEGSVTMSNCVMLGNFNIIAGGGTAANAILLQNSRIAQLTANKKDLPLQIVVTGESCVKMMSAYEYVTVIQRNLSDGLFGTGIEELNIHRAAYVSLTGSYPIVNLAGSKIDLSLSGGTVETFNINKECTLGTVVLDSSATIDTATANAQCAFTGAGKINTLYVNASGVTYETQPGNVIKGDDVIVAPITTGPAITTGSAVTTTESGITATVTPADGTENVESDSQITVTFDEAMTMKDGKAITTLNIPSIVSLKKGSASGTDVSYSATINTAKKKITIIPDSKLAEDTKYYVIMSEGVVKTEDDVLNKAISTSFSTGELTSSNTITFSPAAGASSVSSNVTPTIAFPQAVIRYSGSQITSEYLASDAIAFKKGSSTGSDVAFTARISSDGKLITVTPTGDLEENSTFYLGIKSNKLKTSDGNALSATGVTFTVSSSSLNNIEASVTDKSLVISMSSNTAGTVYAEAIKYASDADLPTAANVISGVSATGAKAASKGNVSVSAGGKAEIELSGLSTSTKYIVYLVLQDSSGRSYKVFTVTATTDSMRLNSLKILPVDSEGNYGENVLTSFTASQSSYTVQLPGDTKSIKVTPDAGSFGGTLTVRVNGAQIKYATELADITKDNIDVVVTATESGKTAKNYTITLRKAPTITAVSCDGSSSNVTKSGSVYTYSVSKSTASFSVVVKMDYAGKEDKNGIFELQSSSGSTIATSTAGKSIQLTPGSATEFKLIVYNSDKTASDEYTLKLKRY